MPARRYDVATNGQRFELTVHGPITQENVASFPAMKKLAQEDPQGTVTVIRQHAVAGGDGYTIDLHVTELQVAIAAYVRRQRRHRDEDAT